MRREAEGGKGDGEEGGSGNGERGTGIPGGGIRTLLSAARFNEAPFIEAR